MKKKIFKYLKNLLIKNKFKIFNRRNFENKFENSNSKVLIEFNAFHYTHCYMSIIDHNNLIPCKILYFVSTQQF